MPEVATLQEAPSVAPNGVQVVLPRTGGRDTVMDRETVDRVIQDLERTMDRLVELEDENKGLRWLLAILVKRAGNSVVIGFDELVTVESDDLLEMKQNPDKTWTITRTGTLDVEPDKGDGA